jgi:hypothetical protein
VKVARWVLRGRGANLQLYNETPLNYLDTVVGIKLISEELNKLSHGMTA